MLRTHLGVAFVVFLGPGLGGQVDANAAANPSQATDVVQRGYDAGVSGATLSETTLTTSNVEPGRFGLVFKLPVDDDISAQPLYVPNVLINEVAHNVLYVATRSDTIYAFDADRGGVPLWTRNLAAFEKAIPGLVWSGTPVIDHATNTLYAVTGTLENNTLVYRLHAVDITTGVPRMGSGVVISGSYRAVTFNARTHGQRVSLVLSGDNVVFGFATLASEALTHLYSGWVMAYDKRTLAQTGIFAAVTTGSGGGGVWQSGRPPAVDSSGYVYVVSGNAFSDDGYDGVHNFGESVLKLDPAHGLRLVDWFTPSNWSTLDRYDNDFSVTGPMLVPGTSLLVSGDKTGVLYVLNTAALGKNTADDAGAVQKIQISPAPKYPLMHACPLMSAPVYWQRSAASGGPLLYIWGGNDRLKAFPFNGTTFATTPSTQGSFDQTYLADEKVLTLSANGETPGTGVLWATVRTDNNKLKFPAPAALYAFDAGNVARELWNSNMDAKRDSFGNMAKFVPPLVANGKVYVASSSKQVAVYGLRSQQ